MRASESEPSVALVAADALLIAARHPAVFYRRQQQHAELE